MAHSLDLFYLIEGLYLQWQTYGGRHLETNNL
jgi:hypothetical protein